MAITAFFFSVLLGCSIGGMEAQPLWVLVLSTTPLLQLVWSLTNWTSCAPSYIIVRHPSSFYLRHKSQSFNPSTVKVISWYSPTGCTCYLHRCISYFDSLAGVKGQYATIVICRYLLPDRTWHKVNDYCGNVGEGKVRHEPRFEPRWSMLVIDPPSAMWAWWGLLVLDPNQSPGTYTCL